MIIDCLAAVIVSLPSWTAHYPPVGNITPTHCQINTVTKRAWVESKFYYKSGYQTRITQNYNIKFTTCTATSIVNYADDFVGTPSYDERRLFKSSYRAKLQHEVYDLLMDECKDIPTATRILIDKGQGEDELKKYKRGKHKD